MIQTATGSELFSLLTCLHATKITLTSILSPLEMISLKVWDTPLSWHAKYSLPFAVPLSKTRVLKLPNTTCAPVSRLSNTDTTLCARLSKSILILPTISSNLYIYPFYAVTSRLPPRVLASGSKPCGAIMVWGTALLSLSV